MKTYSRQRAIDALRQALQASVGDEHSICWVAARKNILCRGFSRWTFEELQQRFPQIVKARPDISRAELEELADQWQLARQFALDVPLACDAQQTEFGCKSCKGWDEFSDEEIAHFHHEFCGEEIEVKPDEAHSNVKDRRDPTHLRAVRDKDRPADRRHGLRAWFKRRSSAA